MLNKKDEKISESFATQSFMFLQTRDTAPIMKISIFMVVQIYCAYSYNFVKECTKTKCRSVIKLAFLQLLEQNFQ